MADPATDQLRLHLVLELHESERSPFSEQSFSVPESVLDDSDHPGRPEQAFLTVHSTPSNWRTQKCAYQENVLIEFDDDARYWISRRLRTTFQKVRDDMYGVNT